MEKLQRRLPKVRWEESCCGQQPSGGVWCLGFGDGRAEAALHSWDFFLLQEGMQGIYPHPKYKDMGLSCPGSFPGTYFCSL